jgi:hypothetical protein
MSAKAFKLDDPIVNFNNVEIESQQVIVKVTAKPTIHEDFFFGDLNDYELPMPSGVREVNPMDRLSNLIRIGIKSGLDSIGSALSLSPK